MINGKRVLAIIPARGGSKGIPRKNVKPLAGKPLLAWSIEAGRACPEVDRVILSSDDAEIIATARQWGCEVPFVRPAELAQDDSPTIPALLHALDSLEESWDYLVLLQATSPLRIPEDISACLNLCEQHQAPVCVSLVAAHQPPIYMYHLDGVRLDSVLPLEDRHIRRQDLQPVYALNGAVYVARVPWFREHRTFLCPETVGHVMPAERSVDLDTPLDFLFAETVLASGFAPRTASTPEGT
ncbi:MAG: acylneuraminate cytidylyltransferase family protein [Magnetococcales bacterium]|nr:acylneuraminate cytidylyltransferase family protein [Magnetococcales bacterium]